MTLKSAVQRRKHLAEAKCTEEACLRRGHSPKVNPKGAQACARRGGSMDFLMESGFMHWMSERMSFTNRVKADFHETSRITLKLSVPPRLRERYRLGAGSSRYGNGFFWVPDSSFTFILHDCEARIAKKRIIIKRYRVAVIGPITSAKRMMHRIGQR